jgi:hypothetical protein
MLLAILLVPLQVLRWYQDAHVIRLLRAYAAAPTTPVAVTAVAPGSVRLGADRAGPSSEPEAVTALGRATARFLEIETATDGCRAGTTLTFRYDSTYAATDFSYAVALSSGGTTQAARLFEPVYPGFRGIDVSDRSPTCTLRVSDVHQLERLPLLLPAQLTPEWEAEPQHQRIVAWP